ncbi:FtsB family cell division protein [Tepidamorphus sp. 3E244]|uniref:FtsB family cell division protein n=1 Tax=Tepidamorphus sp. 3E244 TaxID=3385498 RepID=UPI0038FC399F
MPHRNAVKKRRLRIIFPVAGVIVTAYFGWHAYHGAHGLIARESLKREELRLTVQLKGLKAHRQSIESHIALLDPKQLDPDFLEERAVDLLHFVDPRLREVRE